MGSGSAPAAANQGFTRIRGRGLDFRRPAGILYIVRTNRRTRILQMERRLLERNKVSTTVYLSVPGGRYHRCRARNLSAMGVFLEIKALGLPAGTVVNLVFAVNLGETIRLHRRKAVLAHVSERGAGLMMQGRSQLRPSA
jgi:hypothetical protein